MNGVAVLVLVQLIVESLPISSSSHVEIVRLLMERSGCVVAPWSMHFDHLLHGSMLVVIALFFWQEWARPLRVLLGGFGVRIGLLKKNRSSPEASWYRLCRVTGHIVVLQFLVLLMVSAWYFGVMPRIKTMAWFSSPVVLLGGLIVTALALLSLRFKQDRAYTTFGLREAVVLSVVQMVALFPGISRFASCYVCARWLTISPRRALQVTFAVELPLLLGAFVVHGVPYLLSGSAFAYCAPVLLAICFVGGTIGSFFALRGVAALASRRLLWLFGVYMLVPIAVVAWSYFW